VSDLVWMQHEYRQLEYMSAIQAHLVQSITTHQH